MDRYDALIIGGGPAGASCAQWLKLLGLSALIIEARPRLGGLQNDSPYPNDWIAGVNGKTGHEFAADIHATIARLDIAMRLRCSAVDLRRDGDGHFAVAIAGPSGRCEARGRRVVLATGVRPSTGGLAGGPGILFGPGDQVERMNAAGKRVAILGGGDNGFENYGFVARQGAAGVKLFARSIRARPPLAAAVPHRDVEIGPYVVDCEARTVNGEPFDVILVLYGWVPNLGFAPTLPIQCDKDGFVITDADCATSEPGVYAAGEVARRAHPCCVTAMADGIVAAKAVERQLGRHATP